MTVYNLHAPLLSPSSLQFNSNSISASGGRRKTFIYLSKFWTSYSGGIFSKIEIILWGSHCACVWLFVFGCSKRGAKCDFVKLSVLLCARAQSAQWQAVEDRFSHNSSATNGATCLINIAQQTIVKPKCNTQRSALFGEMLFIIKSKHNHPD